MKIINKDIFESYCSLETLQLLHDKGLRFYESTTGHRVDHCLAEQKFNEGNISYCENYLTHAIVVEWLRVNHGMWIVVSHNKDQSGWFFMITKCGKDRPAWESIIDDQNSPQEAYSAAITYVLTNLI